MSAVMWSKPTCSVWFVLLLLFSIGFWCTIISITMVLLLVHPFDTILRLLGAGVSFFVSGLVGTIMWELILPMGTTLKPFLFTAKGGYFYNYIMMLQGYGDWAYYFMITLHMMVALPACLELPLPKRLQRWLNNADIQYKLQNPRAHPDSTPVTSQFWSILWVVAMVGSVSIGYMYLDPWPKP